MATPEEFKNIVGPLPPADWLRFNLDSEYNQLEPRSAIGSIAIELCGSFISTMKEFREVDKLRKDNMLNDLDEHRQLEEAQRLARHKKRFFYDIYSRLSNNIEYSQIQNVEVPFKDLVAISCKEQLEEVARGRTFYTVETQIELIKFAEELELFYVAEEDLHFQTAMGR